MGVNQVVLGLGLGKGGIFVMGKTKIKMTATRYYLEWPIGVCWM